MAQHRAQALFNKDLLNKSNQMAQQQNFQKINTQESKRNSSKNKLKGNQKKPLKEPVPKFQQQEQNKSGYINQMNAKEQERKIQPWQIGQDQKQRNTKQFRSDSSSSNYSSSSSSSISKDQEFSPIATTNSQPQQTQQAQGIPNSATQVQPQIQNINQLDQYSPTTTNNPQIIAVQSLDQTQNQPTITNKLPLIHELFRSSSTITLDEELNKQVDNLHQIAKSVINPPINQQQVQVNPPAQQNLQAQQSQDRNSNVYYEELKDAPDDNYVKPNFKKLQEIYSEMVNKVNQENDEDVRCDVCLQYSSEDTDQIIICELCCGAVHQSCYKKELCEKVPDGDWLCQRCQHTIKQHRDIIKKSQDLIRVSRESERELQNKAKLQQCFLCTSQVGIMIKSLINLYQDKEKLDIKWVHPICVSWNRFMKYKDSSSKERIVCDSIKFKQYKSRQNNYSCLLCQSTLGFKYECDYCNCASFFHLNCMIQNKHIYGVRQMIDGGHVHPVNKNYIMLFCPGHRKYTTSQIKAKLFDKKSDIIKKDRYTYKYTFEDMKQRLKKLDQYPHQNEKGMSQIDEKNKNPADHAKSSLTQEVLQDKNEDQIIPKKRGRKPKNQSQSVQKEIEKVDYKPKFSRRSERNSGRLSNRKRSQKKQGKDEKKSAKQARQSQSSLDDVDGENELMDIDLEPNEKQVLNLTQNAKSQATTIKSPLSQQSVKSMNGMRITMKDVNGSSRVQSIFNQKTQSDSGSDIDMYLDSSNQIKQESNLQLKELSDLNTRALQNDKQNKEELRRLRNGNFNTSNLESKIDQQTKILQNIQDQLKMLCTIVPTLQTKEDTINQQKTFQQSLLTTFSVYNPYMQNNMMNPQMCQGFYGFQQPQNQYQASTDLLTNSYSQQPYQQNMIQDKSFTQKVQATNDSNQNCQNQAVRVKRKYERKAKTGQSLTQDAKQSSIDNFNQNKEQDDNDLKQKSQQKQSNAKVASHDRQSKAIQEQNKLMEDRIVQLDAKVLYLLRKICEKKIDLGKQDEQTRLALQELKNQHTDKFTLKTLKLCVEVVLKKVLNVFDEESGIYEISRSELGQKLFPKVKEQSTMQIHQSSIWDKLIKPHCTTSNQDDEMKNQQGQNPKQNQKIIQNNE
eukprot:403357142